MKTFEYTIKSETGIHARPAGVLARMAGACKSKITIQKGEKSVDLSKLLALMQMGISCGDTITVTIAGEDEASAYAQIKAFLEENL